EGGAVREVERAAAVFHALARVHQGGVVHRAINPSNVVIDDPAPPRRSDRTVGAPKAMIGGFVAAHVDLTATIAAELDAAGFDDPYAAAEIVRLQSYGYADATSDVYSLALVTLPRLANLNLAAIKRAMADDGALPETSAPWPFLTGSAASQLRAAYNGCLTDGAFANQPRSSAKSMATALDGIARELREDGAWAPGDVLSDQFEIKRLLGEGSSARTYLVLDRVNGRLIAGKQYLRSGDIAPTSPAVREFNLLLDHPHENLPKALGMFDRGVPFFQSRLEYIDGETLRARIPSIRHDRDRWANVARGLLSAGVHLEKHGLLHRDIKPENVMLREADDRVFLIDYGASAHASSAGAPAGSPRYWPPEWRRLDGHPTNCDRYAVAVTLFEALTGVLPFKDAGAAFSSEPLDSPPEGVPARLLPIARLLLTAVSTDPDERPESMRRLRDDLERALAAEDRIIGPDPDPDPPAPAKAVAATEDWIDKLRGVFRNSRRGNSDNRGLDTDFARDTYVRTGLDSLLWPEIQTRRPPVVFLSGNPGDGKTAFLEKVRDRLKRDGAQILGAADPSGWEAETGGHVYRACFDASESVAGLSADEQLANRLRGHDGHDPDRNLTVLVAINDGRLAEVMEAFPARFPWLTGELNRATADGADREQEQNRENRPVWLVDLKQRSYVSLAPAQEASSVMRQMLDSMTSEHRWQGGMPDTRVLAENAAALRRIGPDSQAERLERLLLLAHLRGDRPTTVRDLRSALALIITGDLAPADFASPDPEVLPFAWSGKYWDTIFTTDASRDLVLGEIRWLDPARFAHPKLERFLYFNHRPDDAAKRAALFLDGRDEPPPAGDDPVKLDAWISAVKRRLVLEGAPFAPGVPGSIAPFDLLPYRSADAFVDVLAGRGDGAELLKKILRGIGRSDGISEAMRTGDLVLSVKKSDEFDIEMVKSYPAGDFRLSVPAPRGRHLVETQPRSITLTYAKANARVQLNLDLVEILVRLADGLEPTSQELQPLLEELGPFKSRLQRYSTDRLLVIEGGRRHWIVKDGEKIARQDA
ncbi:MAG: protein kinase domain-containing protein, partial [Thermomicrobiales bacterium]